MTIGKSLTLNGANAVFGTVDNPNSANGRSNVYAFTNGLTLNSGDNQVSMNHTQNGNFGSIIRFSSVSRVAGTTVLFRGRQLGAGALQTNAGNDAIQFTTAPTLVGGGTAIGTTTTSIIPWAIGDTGDYQQTFYLHDGLGTDFVTYGQSATSVQLLTTYATSIDSGTATSNNVKITDGAVGSINAATTINSLIFNSRLASAAANGTTSVDGTGTLTINSGAVMATTTTAAVSESNFGGLYTNNATVGASGLTLAFGATEAIITTPGSSTMTMAATSGGITGTGGLTKSGAGSLNLNAADTISGTTNINNGKIVLGNALALQNSTLSYNNQGGTLSFGSSTSATLGGLSGAQNLALTNASSGAVNLSVGNNNANTIYSGAKRQRRTD